MALRHPVELVAGHGNAGRLPGYISTHVIPNESSNVGSRGEGFKVPRMGEPGNGEKALWISVTSCRRRLHAATRSTSTVNYPLAMGSANRSHLLSEINADHVKHD